MGRARPQRGIDVRRLSAVLLVAALVLAGWGGYSWFVFTDQPDQRTVLVASDSAAPGGRTAAHVVVENPDTGRRVADADVTVYLANGSKRRAVANGTTGPNGSYTARFRMPNETGQRTLTAVSDSGVTTDRVSTNVTVERAYSILVETDRPIYEPGDVIHVRGLVRNRGGDAAAGTATVVVTGPKGNRLFSREAPLNDYGTGEKDFPLSSEAPPGRYRVAVRYDGETRTRVVTVKRYRKPQFEVQFRPEESYYRPGETLHATVSSAYFFGEPVANGTVRIEGRGYVGSLRSFENVTARTDENGVATLSMDLPGYFAGLPSEGGKGLVLLNVSVTDQAGHTETVTRKVPVAQDDVLLNAFTADGRLTPGVPNTVYVTAEYPNGRPVSTEVTVDTPEGARTVETNDYGVARFTYRPADETGRRIALRTRSGGARVEEQVYFRMDRGNRIALALDGRVHDVGDTATGRVYVGERTGTAYLDVVSDGQTVLTRTLDVEDGRANFSIPIARSMQGNVQVRAWAIFGNDRVGSDARRVLVRPAGNVSVEVTANRSVYRPGDPATLTVRTTRDGEPVSSAVGLDVVDESVFAVEERRAGLAAVHYDLEQELLRPQVFVHNYSAGQMGTPTESDDEALARDASVSRMAAPTGGVAASSYRQEMTQIERKRATQRGINGQLWTILLVGLPLGVVAAGFRRRDPVEHAKDLGIGTGLLAVGLALGVVLAVVVVFLTVTTGVAGLVLLLAVLGGLVAGGVALEWNFSDLDFGLVLAALFGAYALALVAGVLMGWAGWIDLGVAVEYWWALVPAFLLFPATFVGIGDDVRRRAYKAAVVATALCLLATPVAGVLLLSAGGVQGGAAVQGQAEDARRSAAAGGVGSSGSGDAGGGTDDPSGSASATEVRQYFPDTLASRTVVTGPDGRARTDLEMADTITTWRVSATAATEDGRLGSSRSSIRVFQPFFVEPAVPQSLTRNDTVTVPVSVFNYRNHSQNVSVRLRGADWYAVDGNDTETNVVVPARSVRRAEFTITAERTGSFPLTVVAVGEPAANASVAPENADERTTDAVRKSVVVRPPGKTVTSADSGTVSGTRRASTRVPETAVNDSTGTVLRIYPGAYGQTIQGIDRLLSMPTGCFEQTSSSLYPDVLALRYMDRTGRSNPELRMTAERYVTTGYQRLLTFETDTPGGYSLFGDGEPNLLLTAYGLQELSDMSEVYAVDPAVVDEMQGYVVSEQRSDGSWPADGRLEYSLGVSGDEVTTTAYVTWSLAHSDYEGEAVDDGADYVSRNLDVDSASTNALAVSLNALAAAGEHPQLQAAIAGELESRAVTDGDGVYWKRSGDAEGYRSGDRRVLTTALVANGLLESDRKPSLTSGAVQWIAGQKTGRGGWGSTQNTVMALRVLLKAQSSGEAKTGTVTVARNGERVATVEVNETTRDEVRTVVLPAEKGENEYAISGPTDSGLYYELTTEYNVPWSSVERRRDADSIDVTVSYDRTNLTVDDTLTLDGRITVERGRVGTALVDLGVPPGFVVEESSLRRLVRTDVVSRYELRGRQLILYAEDVTGTRNFSVRMRATQPIEAKSGSVRVYDYYDPDEESIEAPVVLHVRPGDGNPENGTVATAP